MTHNTDCTVKAESLEDVERIARLIFQDEVSEGSSLARDLGWEVVGQGLGRVVYRVNPEDQEGPRESPTEQAPCVIKFARSAGMRGGQGQNRKEIHQFQALPRNLTEPDQGNPVFVPVKDWDEDNDLWLSMPEVNPEGGSTEEVLKRIDEAGWSCDDIKPDNVGWMHNTSVLLDYGFDCRPSPPTMDLATEMAEKLERAGAEAITVIETRHGALIEFLTVHDLEVEPVETESSVVVDVRTGINFMELAFGQWDTRIPYGVRPDQLSLEAASEKVAEEIEDAWLGVFVDVNTNQQGNDIDVIFELTIEPVEGEIMPPEIAIDLYNDVVDHVEEVMPDHELPPTEEIERRISEAVDNQVQERTG